MDIAYIGMGIMGSAMAANLARAGHNVRVWNRSKNRETLKSAVDSGCTNCDTIRSTVQGSKIVFTCVSDVQDLDEIITCEGGILSSAAPETLVIDTATIGPAAAKTFAETLARKDIRFLDAPVTGGDVGARNATLTIMVGGSQTDFDEALPVLNVIGKNVKYCGPTGSGQALKLCNQILCAINMIGITEALMLAKQFGLDENMVPEILGTGAGGSWALANLAPRIINDDFEPGFRIKDILKDLRLVHENSTADGAGSELPGTALASERFEAAARAVGLDKGTQAMLKGY
ncbi:NAD(P)-dependent oxidoreductase [Candidatus Obscuribacterales bacterium]|nr:NAD(P)-dependent oxidoreductase [Candidatus Obscuribacterales bacterium]